MSELTLDVGQANEIKLAARRAGATNADLKVLSEGDTFAKILPYLRGRAEIVVKTVLEFVARATVTLGVRVNPDLFYRTRTGLYVWDGFRTLVVAKALSSEAGATYNVESFGLTRDMTDEEIEGALPPYHLFDETQLCGLIAGLIAQQPKGEEGVLLNNGYANIFYTGSCVVLVSWRADRRRWRVVTWRRGGGRWIAGFRVFSLAN